MSQSDGILSLWHSLPHAWESDPREPLFGFEARGETWHFYAMSIPAWTELIALLIIEALLAAFLSTLVYKLIVQKQETTISYLVCYGFMLPFWVFAPLNLFRTLKIRHKIFRFCLGAIVPVTSMFRTTGAAHGFTPGFAKKSMKSFALYFACPMTILYDPKLDKFVKSTPGNLLMHLKGFVIMLLVTGTLQSSFLLFPGIVPEMGQGALSPDSDWYHVSNILRLRTWFQNIMIALFYQAYLTCFGEGLILAQSALTGLDTHPIMQNPCMTARSYSDFWGKRWNLVIHEVLKCGVYLPVRKHFSKSVAMLACFVMSGLFHELLLWVFTYEFDDKHGCYSNVDVKDTVDCYRSRVGTTTIFFVWQAALIALEFSSLGKLTLWKHLPAPVATLLILISGGCVAHWFAEPYINSRYFIDAEVLLFVFKPSK